MSSTLGLDTEIPGEDPSGAVEVWLIDARRPWNLGNVFAGDPVEVVLKETGGNIKSRLTEVNNGKIQPSYKPGQGGIIVYDDGDIDDDLTAEREAYCGLKEMEDVEGLDTESDDSGQESDASDLIEGQRTSKKRKSWSDQEDRNIDSEDEISRPRQRRRSNSVCVGLKCLGTRVDTLYRAVRYHCLAATLKMATEILMVLLITRRHRRLLPSPLRPGQEINRQYALFDEDFDD